MNLANFLLLWNHRMPMSEEVIASIHTYGGLTSTITMGIYCGLTAIRACSYNKHHDDSQS